MGKNSTFMFRNAILQELWDTELTGQISDGMWENTNNSGYIYWCNVKSEIGEETKLVGSVPYYIKRKFGFSRLIKYVGDRMMDIVRKHEPYATEKDLKKYLNEIAAAMK